MKLNIIKTICQAVIDCYMFVFMFVCITLPHIAIVIMELSEIKD